MAKNFHKNTKGEFEYGFSWVDEDGNYAGWNSVWASTNGQSC